jgi:hypothetical protein
MSQFREQQKKKEEREREREREKNESKQRICVPRGMTKIVKRGAAIHNKINTLVTVINCVNKSRAVCGIELSTIS